MKQKYYVKVRILKIERVQKRHIRFACSGKYWNVIRSNYAKNGAVLLPVNEWQM